MAQHHCKPGNDASSPGLLECRLISTRATICIIWQSWKRCILPFVQVCTLLNVNLLLLASKATEPSTSLLLYRSAVLVGARGLYRPFITIVLLVCALSSGRFGVWWRGPGDCFVLKSIELVGVARINGRNSLTLSFQILRSFLAQVLLKNDGISSISTK